MLLRWLVHNLVVPAVKERVIDSVRGEAAPAPEDDEATELPPCEIAILFGSAVEAAGTTSKLQRKKSARRGRKHLHAGLLAGRSVIVAECGEGSQAAAETTRMLLEHIHPPWVISAGFATGLSDGLRRGQIVMPDHLVDDRGVELDVGFRIAPEVAAATPGLHLGRLVSLDRLIRSEDERRKLAADHDAIACDAETMAIAQVCRERTTRFLAVRVLTDLVDDRLPRDVESLLRQTTLAGKLGAAAGALFNRPGAVQDVWKIREAATRASDRLANFLAGTVPQLT